MQIGADLGGAFAEKMFGVGPNVFVVRVPRVEMTQQEVMLSPSGFAERNQIIRIKFQLGMQVEGFDMMHLHFFASVPAGDARGLAQKMFSCHSRPLRAAFTPMLSGDVRSVVQPLTAERTCSSMPCLLCTSLKEDNSYKKNNHYHQEENYERAIHLFSFQVRKNHGSHEPALLTMIPLLQSITNC